MHFGLSAGISRALHVARTTVCHIAALVDPPTKPRPENSRIISSEDCTWLIQMATSTCHHQQLPYIEIARLVGIQASLSILRRAFAIEGYHCHIAHQKPFLTVTAKEK